MFSPYRCSYQHNGFLLFSGRESVKGVVTKSVPENSLGSNL